MKSLWLTLWTLLILCVADGLAEEPTAIKSLAIVPQGANQDVARYRLLPTDPELKDGNGVVLMLRSVWEQKSFLDHVAPNLATLAELSINDRQLSSFGMDAMYGQYRGAAYRRDSHWEYPVNDEPLAGILLPDLQGLRNLVGRGLAVRVKQKLGAGDHAEALETLRTQLGCARHISRSHFIVAALISLAISDHSLDGVEAWSTTRNAPNLYWALALLPDSLSDAQARSQWESQMLMRSIPSLKNGLPADEDSEAWSKVAQEFSDLMLMTMQPMSKEAGMALQVRMITASKKYLRDDFGYTEERLGKLSPQAQVMLWILNVTHQVNSEIEASYTLSPPEAIKRLTVIEARVNQIVSEIQAPEAPFTRTPVSTYVSLNRFDRRVKFLQVVESLRDYAAKHEGKFPASLADLDLPAPRDPLTEQPFEYVLEGKKATLAMASIPGVKEASLNRKLELTIAAE